MMEDVTSENGTQVSSIEMKLRCDAGTQADFNVTCEVYTQTPDGNEQPEKRTDIGAAGKDKKIAALQKLLEFKYGVFRRRKALIQEMKKRQ